MSYSSIGCTEDVKKEFDNLKPKGWSQSEMIESSLMTWKIAKQLPMQEIDDYPQDRLERLLSSYDEDEIADLINGNLMPKTKIKEFKTAAKKWQTIEDEIVGTPYEDIEQLKQLIRENVGDSDW